MKFVVKAGPDPWTRRWPDENGPWDLTLYWRWSGRGIECTGMKLQLRPDAAVEPLTASVLRAVALQSEVRRGRDETAGREGGWLVEAYDAAVAGDPENAHLLDELSNWDIESIRESVRKWMPPRPGGRPEMYGQEHYERVATVYAAAAASSGSPTKAVESALQVSRATASRHIARARELGLLAPSTRALSSIRDGNATAKRGRATNSTTSTKKAMKKDDKHKEAKDQ